MGNMDQNWTPGEEALKVGGLSGEPYITVDLQKVGDLSGVAYWASPDAPHVGIAVGDDAG